MGLLGKNVPVSTYSLDKAGILDIVTKLIATGGNVRWIYQNPESEYEANWIRETRKMLLDTEAQGLRMIQSDPEISEGAWYTQLYEYAKDSPVLTATQKEAYQDLLLEEFQGLARYVITKNPMPDDADSDPDRTFEEFKQLNAVQEI